MAEMSVLHAHCHSAEAATAPSTVPVARGEEDDERALHLGVLQIDLLADDINPPAREQGQNLGHRLRLTLAAWARAAFVSLAAFFLSAFTSCSSGRYPTMTMSAASSYASQSGSRSSDAAMRSWVRLSAFTLVE